MPPRFLATLVLGGLLLTVSVVPGVFTVDEANYMVNVLALREGGVGIPGTEGLPPSRELIYFDPSLKGRAVDSTPVTSTAPPLYAPLALPFSFGGWRGLVALNTLAFLGTAALLFVYARRFAGERAAWIAAGAFALAGYGIEYAQGVWPHMLAVFLCTLAFVLASQARAGGPLWLAAAAGLAAGWAAGVRYQDVLVAGGVGLGVLLLTPAPASRLRASAAYGLGAAIPLGLSSLLNHARLGSWNPISKGPHYLTPTLGKGGGDGGGGGSRLVEVLQGLWVRVVDYSAHPPLPLGLAKTHAYLSVDPSSGAWGIGDSLKKAWLQSSPWIGVALVALALAWLAARDRDETPASAARRRELRALSLVIVPVLLAFAAAGFGRIDGQCFNQRYFLELVPLAAVALAWALEGHELAQPRVLIGMLLAVILAVAAGRPFDGSPVEGWIVMKAPLVLALLLVGAWLAARRAPASAGLSLALGACLGWAFAVHWVDDLPKSRSFRRNNELHAAALASALPPDADRIAIFTWWGTKDAFAPLQLERDLVIVDAWPDGGRDTPELIDALLADGRRVWVLEWGFPPPMLADLRNRNPSSPRQRVVIGDHGRILMFEVHPRDDAA